MKIDAAIELIIPDNTAFTVLIALRELGYQTLRTVERNEHVILSVDETETPERIMSQLAHAEIVFNPNKHRMSYAVEDIARQSDPQEFEAVVRDKDENNDRLATLLRGTFGMRALLGLELAVGWRLYDEHGPAARNRVTWACQMLLANPISQTYDIRRRPVRTQIGELEGAAAKVPR